MEEKVQTAAWVCWSGGDRDCVDGDTANVIVLMIKMGWGCVKGRYLEDGLEDLNGRDWLKNERFLMEETEKR